MTVVIIRAAIWIKSVAINIRIVFGRGRGVTSLEDEGVCEFDVTGIADWFDACACSDEGT